MGGEQLAGVMDIISREAMAKEGKEIDEAQFAAIKENMVQQQEKVGTSWYSTSQGHDDDAQSLHVQQADEAFLIGPPEAARSYLDVDKIISVAKEAGADAIHPGYGFLSENAAFSQRCADEGIKFIGPKPDSIRAMGSKSNAKALMQEHNVPTIPGYFGEDQSLDTLMEKAKEVGFPLLIKAAAGGGGKGMRIVRKPEELKDALEGTKREGAQFFGSDE
ncbi:unnamed protein product, partial [Cyprideis torosa]